MVLKAGRGRAGGATEVSQSPGAGLTASMQRPGPETGLGRDAEAGDIDGGSELAGTKAPAAGTPRDIAQTRGGVDLCLPEYGSRLNAR